MEEELLSVGIDVGTSTTQVIFSKLRLQNSAGYFAVPRVGISAAEVIYRGPVELTPMYSPTMIDARRVRELVAEQYRRAGVNPSQVATGAVIITGESARKENSASLLDELSQLAGDFVVSTAGPDLEAVIAGKGSGACAWSKDNELRAVNIDIGGGTSNIVLFDCGRVVSCGCVDVGGRQVRFDADGRVEYISESAALALSDAGMSLSLGQPAGPGALEALCNRFCDILACLLGLDDRFVSLLNRVRTKNSSDFHCGGFDALFLSGGVAQCCFSPSDDLYGFGDIGELMGRAIMRHPILSRQKLIEPKETIRATVVGAGIYTTTVSGSTISYSDGVLPKKSVPVLKLSPQLEKRCFMGDGGGLEDELRWFLSQSDSRSAAVAIEGRKSPSYNEIRALASAVSGALDSVLDKGEPMIIACKNDMAKALGQTIALYGGHKRDIVSLDSIDVMRGDYIDLGRPAMDGLVIPVVVKTLLFG